MGCLITPSTTDEFVYTVQTNENSLDLIHLCNFATVFVNPNIDLDYVTYFMVMLLMDAVFHIVNKPNVLFVYIFGLDLYSDEPLA